MNIRTYSELSKLKTFEERFEYLKLCGVVGESTFGSHRQINQRFYKHNPLWLKVRDEIIIRDNGCDLGVAGYDIYDRIYIHHMNPLLLKDFVENTEFLLNPDFLICTSFDTHNAIHYGDESLIIKSPVERTRNDTCPWKQRR